MLSSASEQLYICPGEAHPISRAVHLARMAAFFPACRECPFRSDTGHLIRPLVERLQGTDQRDARGSLFAAEGVRGVHHNQLTRKTAGALAGALAGLLWDKSPLMARTDAPRRGRRLGPAVVLGYDERPSSPDIVAGVAEALRRTGCQVVDVGLTTKPCFWFAVDHLHAAAGVFVTGSGRDPAWTGLDFALRGAVPMSRGHKLPACDDGVAGAGPTEGREAPDDRSSPRPSSPAAQKQPGCCERSNTLSDRGFAKPPAPATHRLHAADLRRIEERFHSGSSRPTRQAGTHRPFQALVPYEAGLLKHFHALRPLRVCCATPVRLVHRTLGRLFETLPCELLPVTVPLRARDTAAPSDPDMRRLGEAVRQAHAHLGVLIDDDGQRCGFVDEQGTLVPPQMVTRLLAELLLSEHPGGTVVGESADVCASLKSITSETDGQCACGGPTLADVALAMREHRAVLGGGDSGRFWFRETFPTCDGILTLSRLLALLSRSDAPFSALARGANE